MLRSKPRSAQARPSQALGQLSPIRGEPCAVSFFLFRIVLTPISALGKDGARQASPRAGDEIAPVAAFSAAIMSWLCQTSNIRSADLAEGLRGDGDAYQVILSPLMRGEAI